MATRRSVLLLAVLLLASAGLAACGDDGEDGDDGAAATTTTEAAADPGADGEGSTTGAGDDPDATTTEAPPEGETTTSEGGTTTSPNLPPNSSPLADLLLDPTAVGPGFAPDDTLGDGTLDTDFCEEVTLEEAWDDQAAQALLAGAGEEGSIFQQSLLRFPDDAAAEAFADALGEALVTCQPTTETTELEGIGDAALLATAPDQDTTAVAGIVRVGDLVAWHLAISSPGTPTPLDEALLAASADALTA